LGQEWQETEGGEEVVQPRRGLNKVHVSCRSRGVSSKASSYRQYPRRAREPPGNSSRLREKEALPTWERGVFKTANTRGPNNRLRKRKGDSSTKEARKATSRGEGIGSCKGNAAKTKGDRKVCGGGEERKSSTFAASPSKGSLPARSLRVPP